MVKSSKCYLGKYNGDNLRGCILEVDLEYPNESHNMRKYYPFATEKLEIEREMFSDYQLKVADAYNVSIVNVKTLMKDEQKCN